MDKKPRRNPRRNASGLTSFLLTSLILTACGGSGSTPSSSSSNAAQSTSSAQSSSEGPVNTSPEWTNESIMSPKQPLTNTPEGVFLLSTADLNGDGRQDIVTVATSAESIIWYRNIEGETQNLTARAVDTSLKGIATISIGDIDGDGNLDLLATTDSGKAAWYENGGSEDSQFTERMLPELPFSASALSTTSGDLDNDGDIDLLFLTDPSSGALWASETDLYYWYESNGATLPQYTVRTVSTKHQYGMAEPLVSAEDMDGDGDLDLVSVPYEDIILWHENCEECDQRFVEKEISYTSLRDKVGSVTTADLDGDGDLDLLGSSNSRNNTVAAEEDYIAWYENDGGASPTFTEHVITTDTGNTHHVSSADIDGDGDLDILAGSTSKGVWPEEADGSVSWYENDGAPHPNFSKRMIAAPGGNPGLVRAGDLNGDGAWEVFSRGSGDSIISLYSTTQRVYWVAEGETLNVIEDATDADNDSLLYSISHGADADFFSMNAATGQLTFADAPPTSAAQDADKDNIYEVYLSVTDGVSVINRLVSIRVSSDDEDDDNDGVPDSEDSFPFDPSESADTDLDGIGNNVDEDDDGDGAEDEADSSPLDAFNSTPPIWTLERHPPVILQTITPTDGEFRAVLTADLDNDGDKDLISASGFFPDTVMVWHENSGAQSLNFVEHLIEESDRVIEPTATADLDGDGDLDILCASSDALIWYENNGSSSPEFSKHVIIEAESADWRAVSAADLNGDGHLDVLASSYKTQGLVWYKSNGAPEPEFTERKFATDAAHTTSAIAADLDRDGDLDVISSRSDIKWYENEGTANPLFTEHVIAPSTPSSRTSVADMDDDGDLDVLVADVFSGEFIWHENNGLSDPSFTERKIASTFTITPSLLTLDMDSDGDVDLVSVAARVIRWHENEGGSNPQFPEQVISSRAEHAFSVGAADFYDDDYQELYVAGYDLISFYQITQRQYKIDEGKTLQTNESAIDADGNPLTYTISHGPDAEFFDIDSTEGELTFANAPSSSAPKDANKDNVYKVWISVSDGVSTLTRSVSVEVLPEN